MWVDRNSLGGPCNDSRSRVQVSAATPWCTLGKAGVNAQPGDVVYGMDGQSIEVLNTDAEGRMVLAPFDPTSELISTRIF